MQTAINPALAAAMTLQSAEQVGEFQPMTREGQPTVAAQLMQKAMPPAPPAIPDVARQAGLGGQIQAMQMQEAQKQLMNRLMQQQQAPGIMGLNPQMGNFAQGGIVGYATAGEVDEPQGIDIGAEFGGSAPSSDEIKLRVPGPRGERLMTPAEMRNEGYPEAYIQGRLEREGFVSRPAAQTAPAAVPSQTQQQTPPQTSPEPQAQPSALARIPLNIPSGRTYSAESPSAGMFNAARARMGLIPTEPVDPRQGIEAALAFRRAQDEYRQRLGLKPQLEQIGAQEAEMARLMGERERILGERMRQLEGEKGQQGLINFLLGARGFKGEGLGQVMKTGAQAARSYDEAVRGRMQGLEDLKLEVQSLTMEKRNALAKMRDDIATGDYKSAMDQKQKAQNAQNEITKALAEIDLAQGKALSQEAQARMQATVQPSETERMSAEYQRLLRIDPTGKAAQEYKNMIDMFKGAGRGTGERQDLAELKTLQQNLTKQLETVYGKDREPLLRQLEEVNARIFQMAGISVPSTGGSKPPAVGTVMDGYRFKGGNPADKSNWEKV